jgi:protein TonB
MFDNYVGYKNRKARKWVGVTIVSSIVLHVVVLIAFIVHSFWVIDKLAVPERAVELAAAPPPPPPPPPAASAKPKPKKVKTVKVKAPEIHQPVKELPKEQPEEPAEEDPGVVGGVEGGIAGGVVGGVLGGVEGGALGDIKAPPPPPEKPKIVPQVALDKQFLSGERQITPSEEVKNAIRRDGLTRVVGTFKMCVSAGGNISSIDTLKSTGYPAYDRKITGAMRGWQYRPFRVNGKPVPVCTSITFIYKQEN